jgi:hypothetical protein
MVCSGISGTPSGSDLCFDDKQARRSDQSIVVIAQDDMAIVWAKLKRRPPDLEGIVLVAFEFGPHVGRPRTELNDLHPAAYGAGTTLNAYAPVCPFVFSWAAAAAA